MSDWRGRPYAGSHLGLIPVVITQFPRVPLPSRPYSHHCVEGVKVYSGTTPWSSWYLARAWQSCRYLKKSLGLMQLELIARCSKNLIWSWTQTSPIWEISIRSHGLNPSSFPTCFSLVPVHRRVWLTHLSSHLISFWAVHYHRSGSLMIIGSECRERSTIQLVWSPYFFKGIQLFLPSRVMIVTK